MISTGAETQQHKKSTTHTTLKPNSTVAETQQHHPIMSSTAYDNLSLADTDISMAQSWAPKDPDSATFLPALQAQVNGPMPQDPRHQAAFHSSVLHYNPIDAQQRLQHDLTFHQQAESDNTTPTFLSPDEKYLALANDVPIGGLLLVTHLTRNDGTLTPPVFLVTSPPGIARNGLTHPFKDITAMDIDNIPVLTNTTREADDHCYPVTLSVWSTSRNTPLKEMSKAFTNADDCHLFSVKAQKLLRTALLPIGPNPDGTPTERPTDWTESFWLGDAAATAIAFGNNTDLPARLDPETTLFVSPHDATAATRFHTALTAIPLPPGHGLPLGALVPVDRQPKSMRALLAQMFPPGPPTEDTPLHAALALLNSPIHDNWVKAVTTNPSLFALDLCSLKQINTQTEDFSFLQLVNTTPQRAPLLDEDLLLYPVTQLLHYYYLDAWHHAATPQNLPKITNYLTAATKMLANTGRETAFRLPYTLPLLLPSIRGWKRTYGMDFFQSPDHYPTSLQQWQPHQCATADSSDAPSEPIAATTELAQSPAKNQHTNPNATTPEEQAGAMANLLGLFTENNKTPKKPKAQDTVTPAAGRSLHFAETTDLTYSPPSKPPPSANTFDLRAKAKASRNQTQSSLSSSVWPLPMEFHSPSEYRASTNTYATMACAYLPQIREHHQHRDVTRYLCTAAHHESMQVEDFQRAAFGAIAPPNPSSFLHKATGAQMLNEENFLLPNPLTPNYITNVLLAKEPLQVKHFVTGLYDNAASTTAMFKPNMTPTTLVHDNFIECVRKSRFTSIAYLQKQADAWSGINALMLLATTTPDTTCLIPTTGITGYQAKQMVEHLGFLLEMMHSRNEQHYPLLKTSPWTLRGILPGALLKLRMRIDESGMVHNWDTVQQNPNLTGHARQNTIAWVNHINGLITLIHSWSSDIYNDFEIGRLDLQPYQEYGGPMDILALSSLTDGTKSLADLLSTWHNRFNLHFTAEALSQPHAQDTTMYLPPHPCFLETPQPSYKREPHTTTKTPGRNTSDKRDRDIPPKTRESTRNTDHNDKSKSNKTANKAPHPLLKFTEPPSADLGPKPDWMHGDWSVSAACKALADRNPSAADKFPFTINGKQICLQFLLEGGKGCITRSPNSKCKRLHIDIDSSHWTPAKLQPLVDGLKNEHIKKALQPTDHFKTYLQWTE